MNFNKSVSQKMFQKLKNFFMPVAKNENPAWVFATLRFLFAATLLMVPLAYDSKVPEVAGDPRWAIMHGSALLMIAIYFIGKFQTGGKLTFSMPLAAWIAAGLAIIGILTLTWTASLIKSWWFLKHFLAYITLFFFAYGLRHEGWYRNLIWIIIITVIANSILGIAQFMGINDARMNDILPFWSFVSEYIVSIDHFKMSAPPAGTLSNKNLAGSYLVMTLPLTLYLFLTARHRLEQIISISAFTLGTIFLVYTRSRGSWISAIAAVIFLTIWLIANKHQRTLVKNSLTKPRLIILGIAMILIVAASTVQTGLKRGHSIVNSVSSQLSSISKIGSGEIETRIAYNINGVEIVKDNPMGVGLGAFHTVYPNYFNAAYETPRLGYSVAARPQRMHNDLGQAFIELGILGGLGYISIFILMLMMTWKITKHIKGNENAGLLTFSLITGLIGIGVNSLGDFPLQMPTAPALLWTYMGIITGLYVMHVKAPNITLWKKEIPLPKIAYMGLALITIASFIFVTKEDYTRKQGSQMLKLGIARVRAQLFDFNTFRALSQSYQTYPYNTRAREYLGVATVNMRDNRISLDSKINTMLNLLKYDPHSPNGNINLCGLYLQKVQAAFNLKNKEVSARYLIKAEEIHQKLLKIVPFAPHTHALGGLVYLYLNKPLKSLSSYNEALRIDPNFGTALNGAARVKEFLQRTGQYDVFENQNATIKLPAELKEVLK